MTAIILHDYFVDGLLLRHVMYLEVTMVFFKLSDLALSLLWGLKGINHDGYDESWQGSFVRPTHRSTPKSDYHMLLELIWEALVRATCNGSFPARYGFGNAWNGECYWLQFNSARSLDVMANSASVGTAGSGGSGVLRLTNIALIRVL